jgi:DNA-binding NtrC family response regulator
MPNKVRCPSCELMQFEAKACRRCRKPLPPPVVNAPPVEAQIFGPMTRVRTLRELEELAIVDALQKTASVEDAAILLGIGRTTLYLRLRRYGIAHKEAANHEVKALEMPNAPATQGYLFL